MFFEKKTLPDQHYLYVDREAGLTGSEISDAMGSGSGEVFGYVGQNAITPRSMPIALYAEMPGGPRMKFRTGVFVSAEDAGKASGHVKAATIPAGDAVMTTHVGPYTTLNESHKALWDHCDAAGYKKAMPVWEVYVDDPTTKPEAEVKTEIWRRLG